MAPDAVGAAGHQWQDPGRPGRNRQEDGVGNSGARLMDAQGELACVPMEEEEEEEEKEEEEGGEQSHEGAEASGTFSTHKATLVNCHACIPGWSPPHSQMAELASHRPCYTHCCFAKCTI